MKPLAIAALLGSAALLAACGGDAPAPAPEPEKKPEAAPAPEAGSGGGGGLDLASLQEAMRRKEGGGATADPEPAPAPPPGVPSSTPSAAPPATPAAPPAEEAPKEDVPGVPSDISDTEVLMSWGEDEREALNEMSPEERAGEMEKRRLQIFKDRGGVLDDASVKMGGAPVDEATGMRGPARPDAVRPEDLPPADLARILRDIGSRDPEIRAGGIEAARRFPDRVVASKHVVALLKDGDPDVRAIAASVLGSLGQVSSVEPLLQLLEKEPKDQVRSMAVRALRDLGGPEAVTALARVVRDSSEPSDRAAALGMLMDMKQAAEVRALLPKAFDDLAPEVRQQACICVRTLELDGFSGAMTGLLEDYSDNVIVDAIRSLGAMKARSAVGPIMKLLLKPDPDSENPEEIQNVANAALEAITGVKQGYDSTLPDELRLAAIDGWKSWWQKNHASWK